MNKVEKIEILTEYLESFRQSGVQYIPFRKSGRAPGKSVPVDKKKALLILKRKVDDCRRCKLHAFRNELVFGEGNPDAVLMFVGEGPGRDEDVQARPFVGPAGRLLTKIIEAIKLKREDVYIANIIKCRPPKNRDPEEDEIRECMPLLKEQMAIIKPAIICALGRCAAQSLLGSDVSISKVRGRFFDLDGIKVMPTFHPSFLLRNPAMKRPVWEDMKLVKKEYDKIKRKGR